MKLAFIADSQEEESENLIMTDDGSGRSINIPSFIIRKKDATIIKAALKDCTLVPAVMTTLVPARESVCQKVYIKAELEMAHPDNRVEYELWYSTIIDIDYELIRGIALL